MWFFSKFRKVSVFALGLVLATGCQQADEGTLVIGLQADGVAATDTVYLAGSLNGWSPKSQAFALRRLSEGQFEIALPGLADSSFEYKFTKGSWDYTELTSEGQAAPNRSFSGGQKRVDCTVAAWSKPKPSTALPNVSIIDGMDMPQLGRKRTVRVFLPSGYGESTKRYPVLYMHDAQNVFDEATAAFGNEWGVDESVDSLKRIGTVGPAIVVAVDCAEGRRRIDEYSAFKNEKIGGGEGEKYVAFLTETLKPYIDSAYRTLPDREYTGIMGSSMGGLISLYAIMERPDVYSKAGVFSPSLGYFEQAYSHVRLADKNKETYIYLFAGDQEGTDGSVAKWIERMRDTLTQNGLPPDCVEVSIMPGGKHQEKYWRAAFPEAYEWLFEPRKKE